MASGGEGGAHGPMAQFEIVKYGQFELFGFDASFTNAALHMLIVVGGVTAFLYLAMGPRNLVPGRVQSTAELLYEYVANIVRENCGQDGMKYFSVDLHDFRVRSGQPIYWA